MHHKRLGDSSGPSSGDAGCTAKIPCTGEAERDNQSAFVFGQDVDANVQPNKLVLHTRNLACDPDSHPRYEYDQKIQNPIETIMNNIGMMSVHSMNINNTYNYFFFILLVPSPSPRARKEEEGLIGIRSKRL